MKSCIVMFENDFEEIEALSIIDILRRADLKCDMCSTKNNNLIVKGAHNIEIKANYSMDNVDFENYDCIILPGGPAADKLKINKKILEEVKNFYDSGKLVCAICAAPIVLSAAGIIKNKKITSYPGYENELSECIYCEDSVVTDENIITSRGPATAMIFAYKIVEMLCNKKKADELKKGMLYK